MEDGQQRLVPINLIAELVREQSILSLGSGFEPGLLKKPAIIETFDVAHRILLSTIQTLAL